MDIKKKREEMEEIKKSYKKEWVLIADYETDELGHILRGRVIGHSKKREEIYQQQLEYKCPLAIRYTGKIPKDLAVMFYAYDLF